MAIFVGVIALVHIALGFVLATLMLPSSAAEALTATSAAQGEAAIEPMPHSAVPAAHVESAEPEIRSVESLLPLPSREHAAVWQGILTQAIAENTKLAPLAEVLRLGVIEYRGDLVRSDCLIRQRLNNLDPAELQKWLGDIKRINIDWLALQKTALELLNHRSVELNAAFPEAISASAGKLETVLLDQAAQIETTCNNLDHLIIDAEASRAAKQLLVELNRLIALAHALFDARTNVYCQTLSWADEIGTADKRLTLDCELGLHNRLGMELILQDWKKESTGMLRKACVSLIDFDRLGVLNVTLGPSLVDLMLKSVCDHLLERLSAERPQDLLIRYRGSCFAILHANMPIDQAKTFVEEVRTQISNMTFDFAGLTWQLTACCGVTHSLGDEGTSSLLERLEGAVASSKEAGRNCTFADDGNGPRLVAAGPVPPPMHVRLNASP